MYKEHNTEKIDPVVCDEETGIPATEENATMKEMYSASEKDDEEDENDLAGVDECETGYLIIPTAAATIASTRQVPNCCAICLSPYEVGETVVWSCNRHCKHAFHQDCMLDWLTKMFDGTPCPCCRQDFTDMATYQKPRTVKWDPTHAFNPNVIVLR